MREDDSLGHYVPILRRIIILVSVIIAVPVMLWTITIFVRTYVGPPHLPTFHQLAATASINAPSRATGPEGAAPAQDASAGSGPIVEANASTPTGSTPGDRSADQGSVFPPSPLGAPDGNRATVALASADPGAGAYDPSESASAAQPLTGPIPLPRRRPREAEMRTADIAPAGVPMPRRRPDGAGASPSTETTGGNPIGFIQNLFH